MMRLMDCLMPDLREHYDLAIIGGGCAGLSLASNAEALPFQKIAVIEAKAKRQDHAWGVFLDEDTNHLNQMVRKKWSQWQIISNHGQNTQSSSKHPYACLESKAWLTHCRKTALAHGVDMIAGQVSDTFDGKLLMDGLAISGRTIVDSRPKPIPKGMLIQHFIGHEVQVAEPVFDPETAILMDFRCDQSRGIHFIYVLPFSPYQALVESTMFSPELQEDQFYENEISRYLDIQYGIKEKIILRREKGAIPMGIIPEDHRTGIPIGGRGGAIRPSSGYAFTFIQRQIRSLIGSLSNNITPEKMTPHKAIDLWMDRVFLTVLKKRPKLAPRLFHAMARTLNGDEMARFMTGRADMALRLKVVLAMPKWPFLWALISGAKG